MKETPDQFSSSSDRANDFPKNISIVLCTFNGERYLRQQLDSIFNQTLPACEVIVQDDGSTDHTMDILREYAVRFPQMKVHVNEGRHGINANFFSAMSRATCPWIALSDQDDIWESTKLEHQSRAIGDHLLCSGRSVPFSDDGFPVTTDLRDPNYDALRVAYLGALPGHTFLFRRELLRFLPDGASCPYLYDWQLQLIAACAESIVYLPETLVHFRRHRDAATATEPVPRAAISKDAFRYLWFTVRHHHHLQQAVRQRFVIIREMLSPLPFKTRSLKDCLTMAQLQIRRGPIAFLRRTGFFFRHRQQLFYATERPSFRLSLRALLYPFTCGYYYRKVIRKK